MKNSSDLPSVIEEYSEILFVNGKNIDDGVTQIGAMVLIFTCCSALNYIFKSFVGKKNEP